MAIIWLTKIRSERPTSCHQSRLLSPPVASGRHPGTGQQPIPRPDPLWAAGRPGTPSSASAPSATNVQTTVSGSTLFFNWIYFNRQLILKIFTNWNHQTLVTGTLRSKTKVQTKTCYSCSYDKYSWIDNELFTLFLCQVQLKEAADCLHQSADVLRHDSDMAETLDRRRRLFQKLGAE